MLQRPRRNRKSAGLRDLVQENHLQTKDFVYPVFIVEGKQQIQPITDMPGQSRYSIDEALKLCDELMSLGIPGIDLFPKIEENLKDPTAREALNPKGLVPRAVSEIKKRFPELIVFTDVALDPYSSDGHDGLVKDGKILNDETVEVLAKMALVHAEAGADFISPSDMMDGRVKAIRYYLDKNDQADVGILSYTAKYASGFYGPFRSALDSAPKAGDKKTYQMDPANSREALRELRLDLSEGADMVMVKPALSYLDIIQLFKKHSTVPIAAYNVSGEYSMIKAAAQKGWLNEERIMIETSLSMKRAGADIIFSYFARDIARWIKKNS
jgi:porphobilinogen synthase